MPLKRGVIKRRENEDGSYRWYGEYHVPAFGGGGMLTLRLDLTDEDLERGLNRTELWSPILADDDDFKKIAWLRNDAESNSSALEDKPQHHAR